MNFEVLLAKSCAKSESVPSHARLVPHLRAVERAGLSIIEVAGEVILQQLALPLDPWLSRLDRGLRAACLCHDLGKANDGFQKMVRGIIPPTQQPIRHELLGALLLSTKNGSVRRWAFDILNDGGRRNDADTLLECVIGAVGSHHVKLDEEWKKASIALYSGGCGAALNLLLAHRDLETLFLGKVLQESSFDLTGNGPNFLGNLHLPFKLGSRRWIDMLKKDPEWWRFAACLKALLMAADVAGSAMLPERENIRKWVHSTLSRRVTAEQMNRVVCARLQGAALHPFQAAISQSEGRVTFVEAGCGSGKTVAAYLWAARHACGKKLFFCYPTTGTATEGFLGYVHETDIEAKLMHSRSLVDLEDIPGVQDEECNDHLLRIESLRGWSPQVIICTADTVLGLVRNNRRGLYNSPPILSGSFVFDELHAYDNRMFEAVLLLIKALPGASFLLMTASLPKIKREFLVSTVKELCQIPKPLDLEELPRYLFRRLNEQEQAYQIARDAVSRGLKKVLWICNTVRRAQEVFQILSKTVPVRTYHSRFKYEDRARQHRKVIDGFDPANLHTGFIAVTTQVAEMSLDLDADLLITEVAPIPALIQRLGRLNRRITARNPGTPKTAYFMTAGRVEPYNSAELQIAQQWLDTLAKLDRPLSQADLAKQFDAVSPAEELSLERHAEWLDSGWFACPGTVRELGVAVSVILPEDEAACRNDSRALIKKSIPMNFNTRHNMHEWKELKGNLIAPPNVIKYDKEIGARWL